MNRELAGMLTLAHVMARALVAKGVLSKEDLLAELSRVQKSVPPEVVSDLQSAILHLPDR